jgi:hypothetical protein
MFHDEVLTYLAYCFLSTKIKNADHNESNKISLRNLGHAFYYRHC